MVHNKSMADEVSDKAVALLDNHPEGLRFSELRDMICESDAKFNRDTVGNYLVKLDQRRANDVYKPSRGLFRLRRYKPSEQETSEDETIQHAKEKIKEKEFYAPFADWLENEIEDVTKAIPLGGSYSKTKWGTPDVIGVLESKDRDIIKFKEIVTAEIKTDSTQLITAFGQACSYKLFSHKVYLVIPKQSKKEDIDRLDSLCLIFGIGLVTFDANSIESPCFEILARPVRQDPDLFYTNKMLINNKSILKGLFPKY